MIDINDQLWSRLGIRIWKEIDLASEVICMQVSIYYKGTFYFAALVSGSLDIGSPPLGDFM